MKIEQAQQLRIQKLRCEIKQYQAVLLYLYNEPVVDKSMLRRVMVQCGMELP